MKKIIACVTLVFVLIFGIYALTCIEKVEAGSVGVKVNLLGSSKGVEVEILGVGRHWISLNEQLFTFSTAQQTKEWRGTGNSGAFQFQSKEGLSLSADVSLSYSVDPNKVSLLFQTYRKGIDEITNVYVYNMIRDEIVRAASTRTSEELYGEKKTEFIMQVTEAVRERLAPLGIKIDYIAIVGNIWLPQNVKEAIDAKVGAIQIATQRRTEIETAQAEADKKKAEAEGRAESMRKIADAEAYSITKKAEAQYTANKKLAESITPELIRYIMATGWNGVLPKVTGENIPMLSIPLE